MVFVIDEKILVLMLVVMVYFNVVVFLIIGILMGNFEILVRIWFYNFFFEFSFVKINDEGWIFEKLVICCKLYVDIIVVFFFSVWNNVVLLYLFGLMDKLIKEGVVWY